MQTALLGLAIAIILALVSALVAPLVVDWNHYRADFEAEASRLTGLNVHVEGKIDARILPSPVITLRNIEVGAPGREPQLRARSIELEVGLGPLLRGEIKASKVHLIAPQIKLGLNRAGAVEWPAFASSVRPDALSISKLNVEDGSVVFTDAASGARTVLQKLWFDGDVRSFAGPFQGEGAFVIGDALYGYRISGGRVDGAGGLKIRFGIDPANQPLTTDFDGTLNFHSGVPRFDGTFALSRPVGVTLANGRRVMSVPWRAAGKIRATPEAASLQEVAFLYGAEDRAVSLNGRAEFAFGAHPHFEARVAALQVDLDRALAAPDVTRRPPLLAMKDFLQAFAAAVKPPFPGTIGVAVDALTFGGTAIQSLHSDLAVDRSGWSVNDLQFHAPGFTTIHLSGRLTEGAGGFAFGGPASIESADVGMLLAWLKNRTSAASSEAKTLRAHGNIKMASDRIAVDDLAATLGQENIGGSIDYTLAAPNRPAVLDADLHAPALDIDAVTAFAKAAFAGDQFALPQRGAVGLDIDDATFAGVHARAIKTQVTFDAGRLQIDRLTVGDLGGAAFDMKGRIVALSSQPRGSVTLDLNARALDGLSAVLGKFAPRSAAWLGRFGDRLAPASVHAALSVAPEAGQSAATLNVTGQLGGLQMSLDGRADGKPSDLGAAGIRIAGRIDAIDGSALVSLLHLDSAVAVDQLPGWLTISATGPLNGDLHIDGKVATSGFGAAATGALRLNGAQAPTGTLQLQASAADLRPLHQAMTGQPGNAAAASAQAKLAISGDTLSFDDLAITIGKSSLHGHLAVALAKPVGIGGDLEADHMDAAGAAAILLGLPSRTQASGASWSNAPVGGGAFAAMDGAVTFKLDHATLAPGLLMSGLKGVARFGRSGIDFDGLDGTLAAGHVTGALNFQRNLDGLVAHGKVTLADADAAAIVSSGKNGLDGKLTLDLQGDSIGGSPASLVAALHGTLGVTLKDAFFHGLDPAAFQAAIRAADQNPVIDLSHIQAVVTDAMADGGLAVPQGAAALTITSGRVNLPAATLRGKGDAELSLAGLIDLSADAIDLRMTLSEASPPNGLVDARPELSVRLQGALPSPARSLDITALSSWLTLRAAELQTRRLQMTEADRHEDATATVQHPESPFIRIAPPGTVVETDLPPNLLPLAPGARAFDRLQPVAAPPLEDSNKPAAISPPGAVAPGPAPLVIRPLPPPRPPAGMGTGIDGGNTAAGPPTRRRPQPKPPAPPAEHSGFGALFHLSN